MTLRLSALCLLLFAPAAVSAQSTRQATRAPAAPVGGRAQSVKASKPAPLAARLKQCGQQAVCLRLLMEYGAMLVADAERATVPSGYIFRSEAEVRKFQRRAGSASEVVGGVRVELQPQALKAFVEARAEARRLGLEITPTGADAAKRSYADTLSLWQNRIREGLRYWTGRGKLTGAEAERLRGLGPEQQLIEIMKLEERGIYFGAGQNKTVLRTVAAPGASQHNVMLALDIEQHSNSSVREVLARHGWFQTVEGDLPHFTFLGLAQPALASRGLRRVSSGGRVFWLPKVEARTAGVQSAAAGRQEKDQSSRGAGGAVSPVKSSVRNPNVTVGSGVNIPPAMAPLLHQLSLLYFNTSGGRLHITDAMRSPEEQAKAMYNNLRVYGDSHVLSTYNWSKAASEIVEAYRPLSRDPGKAISAMARVIRAQVRAGVYVSYHLGGRAFDIRLSSAKVSILGSIVQKMGGQLVREPDHFHVEFPTSVRGITTTHVTESEGSNESEAGRTRPQ